jgi:hypothetical protein
MTCHRDDHTTHGPTTSERPSALARVEAAHERLNRELFDLGPYPDTDAGRAAFSSAMAMITARRAGWWRVLLVDDRHMQLLHPVLADAVGIAYGKARDDARFWRESAADWQARADGRPTSDAAGALSNWHELEVTS